MNERNGSNNKRGGSKQQAKKRKSRGRGRSKRVDPQKYWGDRDTLVIPERIELETQDPSVVATSLGRAPIPGQENASRHYFTLVYERASLLAGALAAAGDLENMAANAERIRDELATDLDDQDDDLDDDLDDEDDEDSDEPLDEADEPARGEDDSEIDEEELAGD